MISHLSKYHLVHLVSMERRQLKDMQKVLFEIMEKKHGKGKFSSFPALFEEWMIDAKTNEEMYNILVEDIAIYEGLSSHFRVLLGDLVRIMFDVRQFAEVMDLYTGCELLKLIPQDIPRYMMSNYNGNAFNEVSKRFPDLIRQFKDVLVSGKDGVMKPQRDIYTLAISRWNLNPERVMYIDDDLDNIETAKSLGFKTVPYTTLETAIGLISSIIEESKRSDD